MMHFGSGRSIVAIVSLIVAGAIGFVATLFVLDRRSSGAMPWPDGMSATLLQFSDVTKVTTLLGTKRGGNLYLEFEIHEQALIKISGVKSSTSGVLFYRTVDGEQRAVGIDGKPTASMFWVLTAGRYLFETPENDSDRSFNLTFKKWPVALPASRILDAATATGLQFVDDVFAALPTIKTKLTNALTKSPEMLAPGKLLTSDLVATSIYPPPIHAAMVNTGGGTVGLGVFTTNDVAWIWHQIANLSSVACQEFVVRSRLEGKAVGIDYVYINTHDATRNILPLADDAVDPVRLCNERENAAAFGVRWRP